MTLLSICTDAADEIGILRPAVISGSVDPDAQKLLRFANKVGNNIMKSHAWPVLRREQVFTAVSGETQTNILPADFDRFVPETFWNRSGSEFLAGPISPVEWSSIKSVTYSGPQRKFMQRGGDVALIPPLSGGETLAFEYISRNWCHGYDGTPRARWLADDDAAVLDEELITLGVIFEFLDADGQPSARAAAQYDLCFKTLADNSRASSRVVLSADLFGGGRRFGGAPLSEG